MVPSPSVCSAGEKTKTLPVPGRYPLWCYSATCDLGGSVRRMQHKPTRLFCWKRKKVHIKSREMVASSLQEGAAHGCLGSVPPWEPLPLAQFRRLHPP